MNRDFVPLDYPVENLGRKKTNKADAENFLNFRSASFSLALEQFSRPLEYWSPKERKVANQRVGQIQFIGPSANSRILIGVVGHFEKCRF